MKGWSFSSSFPARKTWTSWTRSRVPASDSSRRGTSRVRRFMADMYGRLTDKAGVCLSTLGPGATNLLTGVADATLDHAPLVAITGQVSLQRMHKESHQYIDVMAMFKPASKWQARIAT